MGHGRTMAAEAGRAPQHLVVPAAGGHKPIDIEDFLVWVYRDQKADIVIGQGQGLHAIEAAMDGVPRFAVSACGAAAVARIAELGYRVDGGGFSAGALHIDAELGHEAVMRLDRARAQLVMRYARAGERPELLRPVMVARPVLNGRQRPRIAYDPDDKGRHYGACLVEYRWLVSMARVEATTQEYLLWLGTLRLLAMALWQEDRLTAHRVLAPLAPVPDNQVLDFEQLS